MAAASGRLLAARAIRLVQAAAELLWLALILLLPLYFNVNDSRVFEPDKAILLRDGAAVLVGLTALSLVLGGTWGDLRLLLRLPTAAPLAALLLITLLATATSILPSLSWEGSYARGQGALTTLAYAAVALALLVLLRRPQQLDRLLLALACAGTTPAAYGWIQHAGADPLAWQQADLTTRVPGTMGNPIFLGALLVMTLPAVLCRLLLAARLPALQWRHSHARRTGEPGTPIHRRGALRSLLPLLLPVAGWSAILVVQVGALMFTKSRGPFAGLLAALLVFGFGLSVAWGLPRLRRALTVVTLLAGAALLLVNLVGLGPMRETSALRLLQWAPTTSGTSEVRLDIWGPALLLVAHHPLLGCGPETLQFCYYPVYPTALRHIEAPNAVPDRMHNMLLDAAAETGLLGLAALLAVCVVAGWTLWQLARRSPNPLRRLQAVTLLAVLVGHFVEGFVGIALVATTLYVWVIAAAAGCLPLLDRPAPVQPQQQFPVGTAARRRRGAPTAAPRALPWWRLAGVVMVLALSGPLCWWTIAGGWQALAADTAAEQGASLEQVALGNSGQAPVPGGVTPNAVLALRQFAAAAHDQDTALRLEPNQEEYLLNAGVTLVAWAQAAVQVGGPAASEAGSLYAQAVLDFGVAARLNPDNPDHLRNTGKAYERWAELGDDASQPASWDQTLLARAAAAFARAAVLAPHHPDPLTSEAQVALWQGEPRQALALANRALALDGRDGEGYRQRANAELALGLRVQAVADWRRALANPTTEQVGDTASQLALAEATWAQERCLAVRDARLALRQTDTPDPTQMREIVVVDGRACPGR